MKIIISHLGILGEKPMDFLYTFKGTKNIYFDTALASQDTVMRFIEKIEYGRTFYGSDTPFGTTELHEIRRSMIDLSLEGFLSGVIHSSMAKAVVVCVGGWNENWKKFSLYQ